MLHKHKQPFGHYGASYMRATSTVKNLSFWTVYLDKQCKLRSACSLGIGVIRVYTVAIPSVHCRRITITGSIDFQKCREKIAGSLNEFCNRWCKRENVECDALKDWKLNIFKIIDRRISFYSQNTNMLPRKPKISYRYLKSGIEEFHRKYVLVPADKAANNVVVV